jgi:hypothetical protein
MTDMPRSALIRESLAMKVKGRSEPFLGLLTLSVALPICAALALVTWYYAGPKLLLFWAAGIGLIVALKAAYRTRGQRNSD